MSTAPHSQQAKNESVRQTIRSTTDALLGQYFSGTLCQAQDILNVYMAIMFYESSFSNLVTSKNPSYSSDYDQSSAILKLRQPGQGSAQQRGNIGQGFFAMGLSQSMGWNAVKGASKENGKCLVEQFRPDLISMLCVEPGDDLYAKFLGDGNMVNNILLGLTVLESKWKSCRPFGQGWVIAGPNGDIFFKTRIEASTAGYLGLGASGDNNGTTYNMYNNIIWGSAYVAANGKSAPMVASSSIQQARNTASGPILTGSRNSARVSGCVVAKSQVL